MDQGFNRNALGHEAARLLDTLLTYIDDAGQVQMPVSLLLERTGLTNGALLRARGDLAQRGLLRIEQGFSANGLRGSNVYVLNLSALRDDSGPSVEDESGRSPLDQDATAPQPAEEPVRAPSTPHHAKPGRLRSWLRWGRSAA